MIFNINSTRGHTGSLLVAFNREWNNVGETASAAAAGNRFHSGMVRTTNDPWSYAVTAPMARNLKLWLAFVRPSAATIPSSSADTFAFPLAFPIM